MEMTQESASLGEPLIELNHIYKIYYLGGEEIRASDDVNLTIRRGEFVAIVGKSGSGKSTLMNIIGALDVPTKGDYYLGGEDVSDMTDKQLAGVRNRMIGFIFQQYNLLPKLNILENVELPLLYGGAGTAERKERAMASLERVGLEDKWRNFPNQLSGGQQQRVAIARALVSSDAVIVMDEPITNLDAKLREEMLIEIRQIQKNIGTTIFYITHDQEASLQLCDKMAIMNREGELCQLGADEDIILRPANRFVFEFIGVSNFFTLCKKGKDWCFSGNGKMVFDGKVPAQYEQAGTVDMGVRPNNITFDSASPLKAAVKRSVFLGSEYDYFVDFNGKEIRVQKNAFDANQAGTVEREGETVGLKFISPEFYPAVGKEENL